MPLCLLGAACMRTTKPIEPPSLSALQQNVQEPTSTKVRMNCDTKCQVYFKPGGLFPSWEPEYVEASQSPCCARIGCTRSAVCIARKRRHSRQQRVWRACAALPVMPAAHMAPLADPTPLLILHTLQVSRSSDSEQTYSVRFCSSGIIADEGWYDFSCCT